MAKIKAQSMKITVSAIQFHPKAGEVLRNLNHIARLIKKAAENGSQLVVLPEICDIGYNLKVIRKESEGFPNKSTRGLSEIAKRHGIIIVAGLAEKRGGRLFNTAVVFDPKGKIAAKYDKTHLCPIPPFDERKTFSYGSKIFVTKVAGVRLGLTICYDIRFPEIYRRLALSGAQLVVHPTSFPKARIEQLEVCLRARTIENQFFAVSANFCGKIGKFQCGGRSMITGPSGDIRAKASDTGEEVITATIDLSEMKRVRKERPVLSKRRPELY